MNIWFLTIGNSDVILKDKCVWDSDKYGYKTTTAYTPCGGANLITEIPSSSGTVFSAPARIIGEIYKKPFQEGNKIEKVISHLQFPLIDGYLRHLEGQKLDVIYVFLSDQTKVFSEGSRNKYSPYWKDTCELWPMLKYYLQAKLPKTMIEPVRLEPEPPHRGLDHWEGTLTLMRGKISKLNSESPDRVFVSHQAGTPAMSSALQFISLSLFGDRVRFLVSSELQGLERDEDDVERDEDDVELIESSKYLLGIKVEQAKELLRKGEPGAALILLDGQIPEDIKTALETLVKRFNLNQNVKDLSEYYTAENAAVRILNSLDLIELLFENGKYALATTALAGAHETFLKAALLKAFNNCDREDFVFTCQEWDTGVEIEAIKSSDCKAEWNNSGLKLKRERVASRIKKGSGLTKDQTVLSKLNGDVSNHAALILLKEIVPNFESWALMDLIGTVVRDRDKDCRNQFIHNLRGITEQDAISYLQGNPTEDNKTEESGSEASETADLTKAVEVYRTKILAQFRKALVDVGLCDGANSDNKLRQDIEKLIADLHTVTDRTV
jgi:hypothetical protein